MATFNETVRRLMTERKLSFIDAQIEASQILAAPKWRRSKVEAAARLGERYDGEGMALKQANVSEKSSWIQLAKSGSFAGHSSGPFELNAAIFGEIIVNFYDQKNPVPIDFEHASEADATSGSVPTNGAPAQGWVVDLKIEGEDLWARVEWLPKARDLIRSGGYKFISPAIRFGSKDRVTGKPVGARLTSAGLTNLPFLDAMAPLAAKASGGATTALADKGALSFTATVRRLMSEQKLSLIDAQAAARELLNPKAN